MVNFMFASLPQPPTLPDDVLRQYGMDLTWTGWDGTVWDLSGHSGGVALMAGTRGLHSPQGSRFRDVSPGAHGSQHRATQWHEREVFWPLKLWHDGSGANWVERDRAFWRTMDPDKPGRWTVTQESGEARHLDLRYEPGGDDSGFDSLPSLQRWAHYNVYLTADQPFWTGKPSTMSWKAPESPGPFFEPTGPHLFNIGQGFSLENATIDNLGDVESPPVWYIDGEAEPGAWVGVGGRKVTIPFNIPAWSCLVIDSDPARIGATLYDITPVGIAKKPSERVVGVDLINGRDVSRELGENDFAPVPAGASVSLSLSLSGSGAIEATVPSYFKRAW